MKNLYIIGGTMGVGKTTVSQYLKNELYNCVFLDGDWCWNSNPFIVNNETKEMVIKNICFCLNQFIQCSSYNSIVFCWVLDSQDTIDKIITNIDTKCCNIKNISLVCNKKTLEERLKKDIKSGTRNADIINRSIEKIEHYKDLGTIKINTDNKSIKDIVDEIKLL